MKVMNNTLALSTTAFFNDRGCHIRIEHIMRQMGIKQLIAYKAGRDRDGINTIRIHSPSLLNYDYIGFRFAKIILDILVLILTVRIIRQKRPDTVLAFTHEAGIVAMIAGALTHTPFVLDYQGSLSGEMQSYLAFARMKTVRYVIYSIEKFIENKAAAIIYNTEFSYAKSNYRRKYLVRDDFEPLRENEIASFREGNEKIVLWMGPLTKRQGLDELLIILKSTMNVSHRMKFVIIGHSEELEKLRKVYKNAIFTGRVGFEFIPSIIRDADICISTKNESMEGSHKLHMYKKYGKRIFALKSKAAEEMLSKEQIVENVSEMIRRIMEII